MKADRKLNHKVFKEPLESILQNIFSSIKIPRADRAHQFRTLRDKLIFKSDAVFFAFFIASKTVIPNKFFNLLGGQLLDLNPQAFLKSSSPHPTPFFWRPKRLTLSHVLRSGNVVCVKRYVASFKVLLILQRFF